MHLLDFRCKTKKSPTENVTSVMFSEIKSVLINSSFCCCCLMFVFSVGTFLFLCAFPSLFLVHTFDFWSWDREVHHQLFIISTENSLYQIPLYFYSPIHSVAYVSRGKFQYWSRSTQAHLLVLGFLRVLRFAPPPSVTFKIKCYLKLYNSWHSASHKVVVTVLM